MSNINKHETRYYVDKYHPLASIMDRHTNIAIIENIYIEDISLSTAYFLTNLLNDDYEIYTVEFMTLIDEKN